MNTKPQNNHTQRRIRHRENNLPHQSTHLACRSSRHHCHHNIPYRTTHPCNTADRSMGRHHYTSTHFTDCQYMGAKQQSILARTADAPALCHRHRYRPILHHCCRPTQPPLWCRGDCGARGYGGCVCGDGYSGLGYPSRFVAVRCDGDGFASRAYCGVHY